MGGGQLPRILPALAGGQCNGDIGFTALTALHMQQRCYFFLARTLWVHSCGADTDTDTWIRTRSVCVHIDTATRPVVGLSHLYPYGSRTGTLQGPSEKRCMRHWMGRHVRIPQVDTGPMFSTCFIPNRIRVCFRTAQVDTWLYTYTKDLI